jgi:gamma-glutamylcyclotransferase (GGCT)/AIG2-like uncharacterized protein YtfP
VKELVFVYGSLRRGQSHQALLRHAKYVGVHKTEPRYTMFSLGAFPAVVAGGCSVITGEVFAMDQTMLSRLDEFEDCPGEYVRTEISTRYGKAWIYVFRCAPTAAATVTSGDWCNR